MKNKNSIAIAIIGLMLVTGFAGCLGAGDNGAKVLDETSATPEKIKLIIDADPALGEPIRKVSVPGIGQEIKILASDVDDALAQLLCYSYPENIEVLGVTAVYGCGDINTTYAKSKQVINVARRDVPVFKGAASADDFGKRTEAVDFLIKTVMENPGEITLLTTGPLTNVGTAMSLEPNFASKLKGLYMMGGAIGEKLVTQAALLATQPDYNFAADPVATQIVVAADVETHTTPLDVCLEADFTRRYFDEMVEASANNVTRYLRESLQGWLNTWYAVSVVLQTQNPDPNENGFYPWDVVAACRLPGLPCNDIFTSELYLPIDIDSSGRIVYLDPENAPESSWTYITEHLDESMFLQHFFYQMTHFPGC